MYYGDINIITQSCEQWFYCDDCIGLQADVHKQNGTLFVGPTLLEDDSRGFRLQVVRGSHTWQYVAGCRQFTFEQACAHWGGYRLRQRDEDGQLTDDARGARKLLLAVIKQQHHISEIDWDDAPDLNTVDHLDWTQDTQDCEHCHQEIQHAECECLVCSWKGCSTGALGEVGGPLMAYSHYDECWQGVCDDCIEKLSTVYAPELIEQWLDWRGDYYSMHARLDHLPPYMRYDDNVTNPRRALGVWHRYVYMPTLIFGEHNLFTVAA